MWPFTRKPKPLNPGPINEDWRVGDLAECIVDGKGSWYSEPGPERGDVNKVTHVVAGQCARTRRACWGLILNGYDGRAFGAHNFRKDPPLNSEADAEITAENKALKPKREQA